MKTPADAVAALRELLKKRMPYAFRNTIEVALRVIEDSLHGEGREEGGGGGRLKTPAEIAAEVAALEALLEGALHRSIRIKIEVALRVIKNHMSDDRVEEEYGDDSTEEFDNALHGEALNARGWVKGETRKSPSAQWREVLS